MPRDSKGTGLSENRPLSRDAEVLAIVAAAFASVGPQRTKLEACALAYIHLLGLERERWAVGDYASPIGPAVDVVAAMFKCAAKGAPS